jgi:hypothetical protein
MAPVKISPSRRFIFVSVTSIRRGLDCSDFPGSMDATICRIPALIFAIYNSGSSDYEQEIDLLKIY